MAIPVRFLLQQHRMGDPSATQCLAGLEGVPTGTDSFSVAMATVNGKARKEARFGLIVPMGRRFVILVMESGVLA